MYEYVYLEHTLDGRNPAPADKGDGSLKSHSLYTLCNKLSEGKLFFTRHCSVIQYILLDICVYRSHPFKFYLLSVFFSCFFWGGLGDELL